MPKKKNQIVIKHEQNAPHSARSIEMNVADIENPNNPGGGDEATPEPDIQSEFALVCCMSCIACTVLAASAGLVLLFFVSSHADMAVRVLADLGFVVGVVGLTLGCICCGVATCTCIQGNLEGTRQAEAPRDVAA